MGICGSVLCCAASGATSCCNAAGSAGKRCAQLTYVALMVVSAAFALVVKNYPPKILETVGWCQEGSACQGNNAVYRISFGTVIFFALLSLLAPLLRVVHMRLWGLKVPLYLGLIVGSFYLPADMFVAYASVSRVISFVFLMLQVLILIEFAYDFFEYLVGKAKKVDEEREIADGSGVSRQVFNSWRCLYLVTSIVLSIIPFAGCIGLYFYFSCAQAYMLISVTLICSLVFIAVGLYMEISRDMVGWLTGATVATYITWLCFSALTSMPDSFALNCNPACAGNSTGSLIPGGSDGDNTFATVSGIIFAGVSIGYAGYSVSSGALGALSCGCCGGEGGSDGSGASEADEEAANDDLNAVLAGGKPDSKFESELNARLPSAEGGGSGGRSDGSGGSSGDGSESTGVSRKEACNVFLFHITMVCCGFYMAMIVTNWADDSQTNASATGGNTACSEFSMWVKLISQWVTSGLFVWTIAAPVVCTGRDFS